MAKDKEKKKPEKVMTNGAKFGFTQLARDLLPSPAAQRIIQLVNNNGVLTEYITENAYHRAEAIDIFDKLVARYAYGESITKGAATLLPVKWKIHWVLATDEFLSVGGHPDRMDPSTGEVEIDPNAN